MLVWHTYPKLGLSLHVIELPEPRKKQFIIEILHNSKEFRK